MIFLPFTAGGTCIKHFWTTGKIGTTVKQGRIECMIECMSEKCQMTIENGNFCVENICRAVAVGEEGERVASAGDGWVCAVTLPGEGSHRCGLCCCPGRVGGMGLNVNTVASGATVRASTQCTILTSTRYLVLPDRNHKSSIPAVQKHVNPFPTAAVHPLRLLLYRR